MTAKPLITEAIALTEKKMDMKLEDIIKLSKNKSSKPGKQRRVSNKSQKFTNNFIQDKPSKMRRYMDSRSSLRQGALAKRRSTFQGNQFPIAVDVARKAVTAPRRTTVSNRNRGVSSWNEARFRVSASQRMERVAASGGFLAKQPPLSRHHHQQESMDITPKQRPQTLDSLFASLKEQRMRVSSRQNNGVQRNGGGSWRPRWGRGGSGH